MTQEEKAKRYEQTLERAREAKKNTESAVTIGILEEIFPELRESEDERIRKALLYVISGYEEEVFNRVCASSQKECIAWLEKQGEPTETNPSEFDLRLNKLLKQFETLPKEELISNLSYYLNVIQNDGTYKIEKKGEQKHSIDINKMVNDYANNKEPGNEIFGRPVPCMVRAYRQGLNDAIRKVALKTWSEEDEEYLDSVICALSSFIRNGGDAAKEYVEEEIDWLKKLKERIGG